MKIMLCTTPIGSEPDTFPPFGSLAIMQALRQVGRDPIFFDIDALRPPFEDVIARFRHEAPDVVGISAVVSTAYGYTKRLCLALHQALPRTRIVVGGNLAASAEMLHRMCGVDVCVIGEGERPIVDLIDCYLRHRDRDEIDYADLERIKSITYLDAGGHLRFTGYGVAIPADELLDPDFSILEAYSDVERYINDPFTRPDFASDPRSYEPHRAGKKMGTVVTSKGCVARCTFCHRWDRGFRQLSPAKVIGRTRHLMERYNVGFIQIGDENFGSDRKALDEFLELIAPLDVLWKVGGMRARTIDLPLLKRMRDAGCVAVYYGFETGSPDILKVMEKNLKLDDNLNAARATHEAGLFTIYQLVLGMPGETPRTVRETLEMVKQITEFLPDPPYKRVSINFAQALPGTPLYEYARFKGLIGPTLQDEETYLLSVSDTPAGNDTTFIDFTGYPYLTVQTWRPRILYEATVHWLRQRKQCPERGAATTSSTGGWGSYFNLLELQRHPRWLVPLYPLRWALIWTWTLVRTWGRTPSRLYWQRLGESLMSPLRRNRDVPDYRSLREIMRTSAPAPQTLSEQSVIPLRLGR